jgi:hypothetical protein
MKRHERLAGVHELPGANGYAREDTIPRRQQVVTDGGLERGESPFNLFQANGELDLLHLSLLAQARARLQNLFPLMFDLSRLSLERRCGRLSLQKHQLLCIELN